MLPTVTVPLTPTHRLAGTGRLAGAHTQVCGGAPVPGRHLLSGVPFLSLWPCRRPSASSPGSGFQEREGGPQDSSLRMSPSARGR